jgi:hypothetical protein
MKAEEFDFEYVGSKNKEKFQRLHSFLSRSKHLNFVDTLTLAAILDFLIIIIIIYYTHYIWVLKVMWPPGARAFSRLPNDKKGKALGTRLGKINICPENFLYIWKHFGTHHPPPPPLSNLTHTLRRSARNGTEYTYFENRRGVIAYMYF